MPNEPQPVHGKVLQCVNDNMPLYIVIDENKQVYAACVSCKEARFKFDLVYDPERRTLVPQGQ
jgi:hypothetical protein